MGKLKMPKGAGLTKPMKLSAELADIVGKKEASRAECIKQLWAYIKKNNLQDPEQAVLQPRQEDGQGLRQRPDPCFRYGQVHQCPPLIKKPIPSESAYIFTPHHISPKKNPHPKFMTHL